MRFLNFLKFIAVVVTFSFLFACSSDNMDIEESKAIFAKSTTDKKITICHYDKDTDTWETLSISKNALQAHLNHGDKIGPCGYTYIPDDNFEAALAEFDDIPNDNLIPTSNIEIITSLTINGRNIRDLTGLQDFSELKRLSCSANQISILDLSGQTDMVYLRANDNMISKIDVSKFSSLKFLYVYNNQLTELYLNKDQNGALNRILCQNNMLESLNMSNFKELQQVRCEQNNLSVLNVKNGFNENLRLSARNNDPQLLITVDDPIKASAGLAPYDSWGTDPSAVYN